MCVPGARPDCRMGIGPRRSEHSPRSWMSVYRMYTTVATHIPGVLVVVSRDIVP